MKEVSMNNDYLWFDFENAPHVLILSPIIQSFKEKGYKCLLTARDFSYTVDLCHRMEYEVQVVGRSGIAKSNFGKMSHILMRATKLQMMFARYRHSIRLAISHGSRSQLLAAYMLKIPTICMDDYEFSYQGFSRFANNILVPFPIDRNIWRKYASRVVHYPGLKEELYLHGFIPDDDYLPDDMNVQSTKESILVLFRPSGTWSHYRSDMSYIIQQKILEYLADHLNIYLVIFPRDKSQSEAMRQFCVERNMRFYIPSRTLDGPQLIWNMDLVIGGGGTMTREAAVLGVPSYSYFGGQWGAVDKHLESCDLLIPIKKPEEVSKIILKKRNRNTPIIKPQVLDFVTSFIENKLAN
jgi:hypothetical protein